MSAPGCSLVRSVLAVRRAGPWLSMHCMLCACALHPCADQGQRPPAASSGHALPSRRCTALPASASQLHCPSACLPAHLHHSCPACYLPGSHIQPDRLPALPPQRPFAQPPARPAAGPAICGPLAPHTPVAGRQPVQRDAASRVGAIQGGLLGGVGKGVGHVEGQNCCRGVQCRLTPWRVK